MTLIQYMVYNQKQQQKYMKRFLKALVFWPEKDKNQSQQTEKSQIYIRLTYRSHIEKADKLTYYNSDSGWGCMIRVGQMLIANIMLKQEKVAFPEIIRLFYDSKLMPFSIQMFTRISKIIYQDKKQYEWYTPCQVGFIVKELFDTFDLNYRVSICNDNTLFLSDIQQDRNKLLVILMCRLGLNEPEPQYLKCVIKMTSNPYFFAIMGGVPKRAHLFLKHKDGYFGYLDPHQTLKTPKTFDDLQKHQQQYVGKLQWLKESKIDSSMGIVFIVQKQEIEQFYKSMEEIKVQIGNDFFLYMDREKPEFNQEALGIQVFE